MSDMKSAEQLAVTMIGTSSWGSQTAGIGSVMGSTWSEKIIFDAQPNRVISKYFLEFDDLMATNDVTLILPKIGDVNLMGGRTGSIEGVARVMTLFNTADNITVSLTSADVKLGGCEISFETASATRVSIVQMAHEQLVRQYLETIEDDAVTSLIGATVHATDGASSVWGGSTLANNTTEAASEASLVAGDKITVDKIVEMLIEMQVKKFAKKSGDAVIFLHPYQFRELLKSSQFTNASEKGDPTTVNKGTIEEYIGVKIEVTTMCKARTNSSDAWGVDGYIAMMIDPTAAAGIVWKEKAKIKVETLHDERTYKVLLDAWYKYTRINENAICLGYFAKE